MIKTGIIGYPLDWTLSPKLHNFMFDFFNIKGEYKKIITSPSNLKETIKYIKDKNFRGLNITIPFKEKIIKYIDETDISATIVDAVNTISFINGKSLGFNTDTIGFEKSLDFHNLDLAAKNIILVGTGGAAKACAFVIKKRNPNEFFIVGRNHTKTEYMGKRFEATPFDFKNLEKIMGKADILINATPIELDDLICRMKDGSIYYDLKYKKKSRRTGGVNMINGLIMLIYQGIESFYLWTGKRISINPILNSEVLK